MRLKGEKTSGGRAFSLCSLIYAHVQPSFSHFMFQLQLISQLVNIMRENSAQEMLRCDQVEQNEEHFAQQTHDGLVSHFPSTQTRTDPAGGPWCGVAVPPAASMHAQSTKKELHRFFPLLPTPFLFFPPREQWPGII